MKYLLLFLLLTSSVHAENVKIYEASFPAKQKAEIVRFGDLTGDGKVDYVIAQNSNRIITFVAAYEFSGKLLWKIGVADPSHANIAYDLPIQVFDLDGDGKAEVILVYENEIQIRSGQTGAILRETIIDTTDRKIPKEVLRTSITKDITTNDSIFIAKLFSADAYSILVKDRYTHFVVYSKNLRLQYESGYFPTGHYPTAHDIDGDGIEDLGFLG